MDLNKIIRISTDVLSQEVSGETVLLNLKSENYYGLDEVGTRVWQLLNEYDDLSVIYSILLQEYDVDEKQLHGDLDEVIKKMLDAKIVQIVTN